MSESAVSTSSSQRHSGRYRYYVLSILTLMYAFSFMDRNIVAILLGDLKAEFDLNDTQLGLLGGLAFALFYSTLAIPVARLADRTNRINIITIALTLWSLVTALCAAVTSFTQLFLCRIGVGVGEAGGLSPAHSVISDYFNANERSLAISFFSLGAAVGVFLGMAVGGLVAEHYGWRVAFLMAGLPGLALAALLFFTVREPVRGGMDSSAKAAQHGQAPKESFADTLRILIRNRVYVLAVAAHILAVFGVYSLSTWMPQLMLRNFDVAQSQVGLIVGLIFLIGATGGVLSGGYLATRMMTKLGPHWELLIPTLGLIAGVPLILIALFSSSMMVMSILLTVGFFFYHWQHGPGLAVVQNYVEPHQRATAASLNFFLSNLLGLGLGPLLVGTISDFTAADLGNQSLNVALSITTMAGVPAAAIFYWASRRLT